MLGKYADVGMNFVSGAPLNERNRVEVLIDDQGLYRETQVNQCNETGGTKQKKCGDGEVQGQLSSTALC